MQSSEEIKTGQLIYSIQNKINAINSSADHMHEARYVIAMRKINLPYIKDKLDDLAEDIYFAFNNLVSNSKFSKQEIFDNFVAKLFTTETDLPNLCELMENLNEIYLNKIVLYYNGTVRSIPLESKNNVEAAFVIEEQYKNSEHFFIPINDLYKNVKYITDEINKDVDLKVSEDIRNQFTKFYNEYEDALKEHINFSSFLKSKREELTSNKTPFTKVNYKYVRKSEIESTLTVNKKDSTKVKKKIHFQNSEIIVYPIENPQAAFKPCKATLKEQEKKKESNLEINVNLVSFEEFIQKSKITNSTMNYIRRSLSNIVDKTQSAKSKEDMILINSIVVEDIDPFINASGFSRVFYAKKDSEEFILANPNKVLYHLTNIKKVMYTALKAINYAINRSKRLEADSTVKELEDFKFMLSKELSSLSEFISITVKLFNDNKVIYDANNTDANEIINEIILDFQEVNIEEKLPISSVKPAKTFTKSLETLSFFESIVITEDDDFSEIKNTDLDTLFDQACVLMQSDNINEKLLIEQFNYIVNKLSLLEQILKTGTETTKAIIASDTDDNSKAKSKKVLEKMYLWVFDVINDYLPIVIKLSENCEQDMDPDKFDKLKLLINMTGLKFSAILKDFQVNFDCSSFKHAFTTAFNEALKHLKAFEAPSKPLFKLS